MVSLLYNLSARIPVLLSDFLSGLLPSDGPGVIDMAACFSCHGNVYIGRSLAVDNFSGSDIPAFSCDVTFLLP
jgi:hypothetical protein